VFTRRFQEISNDQEKVSNAYASEHLQASHPSHADCLSDRSLDFLLSLRFDSFGRRLWGRLVDRRLFQHDRWSYRRPLAAVPGFIDLLFYKGGAPPVKKIALTHMAINLTAVVLYAINIWLRASGPTNLSPSLSAPVVLSIIGVALLFVSGWLGGQMVHVYGVGVEGRE
jgi:fatty acid desaturase